MIEKNCFYEKTKILKEFKPLSWEDVFNKYFLCKWNDNKMKKFLFVVPHPDDEIVGSCIILRRIINQGNEVHVFF